MRILIPTALCLVLASLGARADGPSPFTEVDPSHTSPAFKAYVKKGLEKLTASGTPIGKGTRRVIEAGKVKLDQLNDLTRADFLRARKELLGTGPELDLADFARLHDERTRGARALKKALNGYMWDDRVYVASGMTPLVLAQTLAHETNHVLNHSEKHYRTNKEILREEYRAFTAEKMLRGETMTKAKCKKLKEDIIRDYGLKRVTAADVPDKPTGTMIP